MLRRLYTSGLRWIWIAIAVVIVDRASKYWVLTHLNLYEPMPVFPFFNLTLAYNTGAAFSFLDSADGWQNVLFVTLAASVSLAILRWLYQSRSDALWLNIGLCLVLGGAIGNVWDRLIYSYVIDFLDFYLGTWHFAIFNIADTAICVGAFMIVLGKWREEVND